MRSWPERHHRSQTEPYYCECSDLACLERVRLTREEYEAVRRHARRFVIRPGHATIDIERMLEARATYCVVEKDRDLAPALVRTDPRN